MLSLSCFSLLVSRPADYTVGVLRRCIFEIWMLIHEVLQVRMLRHIVRIVQQGGVLPDLLRSLRVLTHPVVEGLIRIISGPWIGGRLSRRRYCALRCGRCI